MVTRPLTKLGVAHVSDFFDWAKANVLKEDTPWIHIKTINGTYRWERPKPKRKVAKKKAKARK